MLIGSPAYARAGYETGINRGQLSLFNFKSEYIQKDEDPYWLRGVCNSTGFSAVDENGCITDTEKSSTELGVRPYFCICAE